MDFTVCCFGLGNKNREKMEKLIQSHKLTKNEITRLSKFQWFADLEPNLPMT